MTVFDSSVFDSDVFLCDDVAAPDGGGGIFIDAGKYRKHLLEIAEAADRRLYKKLQKKISVLANDPTEEVADVAREIQVSIDFSALAVAESQISQQKLWQLLIKLDQIVEKAIMHQVMLRESEDELIILMAIP